MNKTKKAIFEAAVREFSECGYNGATMDEIALKAGVAKGTLYYHFKSKEEIFSFVVVEGIRAMQTAISQINDMDIGSFEKIRLICKNQLTLSNDNREFFKVLISQIWGKENRQSEIRLLLATYFREIEKVMKQAMSEGIVKQGDPELMSFLFFGNLIATAIYEILNKGVQSVDDTVDEIIELSLRGILA